MNAQFVALLMILSMFFPSAGWAEDSANATSQVQTDVGCNDASQDEDEIQRQLNNSLSSAKDISVLLDVFLCPVSHTADDGAMQQRALRAQMVIGMLARYGAARIPQYSKEHAADDAAQLLTTIHRAESSLASMLKQATEKNHMWHVQRTELQFDVLSEFNKATKPTVRHVFGLFTASTINIIGEARNMLKNVVKDHAFLRGYKASFKELLERTVGTDAMSWQQAWEFTLPDTERFCKKLRFMAQINKGEDSSQPDECTAEIHAIVDNMPQE